MTASLTENSFPSIHCHCELNVSSTWWMAFSAKICFDQVSALFCLTPPDSAPFSSLSSFCRKVLSFFCQATPVHRRLAFLLCSGQALCLAVICEPKPWAMCFRVSGLVSVCMCTTLIPASVSQTTKQSDWLELGRVNWDKGSIRRVILADQTATLL